MLTSFLAPVKNSCGWKLLKEILLENEALLAQWIIREHAIELTKMFQELRVKFRLKVKHYEQVMFTICGLIRLRFGALILLGLKPPTQDELQCKHFYINNLN